MNLHIYIYQGIGIYIFSFPYTCMNIAFYQNEVSSKAVLEVYQVYVLMNKDR